MSYSRWLTSRWYTFWSAKGPDSDKKNDQIFEICELGPALSFTYAQLTSDIDKCLEQVKDHYSKERKGKILTDYNDGDPIYKDTVFGPNIVSKDELEELRAYMLAFMEDVKEDKDFK